MEKLGLKNKRSYISWSQYSLFLRNPDEYYRQYILGEDGFSSPAMELGSKIHTDIENDTNEVVNMEVVKLLIPDYKNHEKKIKVEIDGVPLYGIIDLYSNERNKIRIGEIKTSTKKWTQKQADKLGQLKFYNLLVSQINKKRKPIETELYWVGIENAAPNGDFKAFRVYIKLSDVAKLFADIKRVWNEINKMWKLKVK